MMLIFDRLFHAHHYTAVLWKTCIKSVVAEKHPCYEIYIFTDRYSFIHYYIIALL